MTIIANQIVLFCERFSGRIVFEVEKFCEVFGQVLGRFMNSQEFTGSPNRLQFLDL